MNRSKIKMMIALLLIWVIAARIVEPLFLPPVTDVLHAFFSFLFSFDGVKDVFFTVKRTCIGFFIGLAMGVPSGVTLGLWKHGYESCGWLIDFFRSVPVTALFPLFLLFFGFGDVAKIAMGAWASGFILLVSTMHAVQNTKENRKVMAIIKGATPFQVLTKITLPETLPFIFAGMKIGISWNLIVVIVAEMFIGASSGVGHRIYDASVVFDTASVFASIFVIGCIGLSMNKTIAYVEKIVHWKGK